LQILYYFLVLKITVLGSSGSEGIPQPFCKCRLCRNATGKDIRLRSSYLITLKDSTSILLDASPDWRQQALKYNVDFDFLFLSHRHFDHTQGLEEIRQDFNTWKRSRKPKEKRRIFLIGKKLHAWLYNAPANSRWKESTQQAYQQLIKNDFFQPKTLIPYQPFFINKNLTVTLVRGKHGGCDCNGLLIATEGKTVVYLADIAFINGKLNSLMKSRPPNLIIAHAPFFYVPKEAFELTRHLGVEQAKKFPGKKILLSHFSHRAKMTHQEMVKRAKEIDPRLLIAYDGQTIEI